MGDVVSGAEENQEDKIAENKSRLVFFVKPGLDSFLGDIIRELSDEYETKKIIVTEYKQIDEWMQWTDVCWFEWCDELVDYGSKLDLAKDKKIVCRLHRYEALTSYPENVAWENVDELIIVTEHLEKLLVSRVPDIQKKVDIITINNGVDLCKYELKKRKTGFNIAYVGYINSRKNPILLLQIMHEIVKKDKRYKLYVAGQFQEYLIQLYWNYEIEKMGLGDNIIFEGWQNNINNWLQDKNYIISTSIHESFGYGIAEAMSRGIKPIIHDFVFADEIWDSKYLFNGIDEAISMIFDKNYDSNEYRKFVEDNYSLDNQMHKIKDLLLSLNKKVLERKKVTLDYLILKFTEVTPYTHKYIDFYNFEECNIKFGKVEKVNTNISLIEFVIENMEGRQLVLQDIWYDDENRRVVLPEYISYSKNREKIQLLINTILQYKLQFNGNIAGFINDEKILENIKKDELAYIWERGVPGTEFLPAFGYLKIIERYTFASKFIKDTDVILEGACGFGYGAAYFAKLCNKVYALDIAKENIDFGKKTYCIDNIEWINGDVTKLPFKDNEFNVYTSFETLEHLSLKLINNYFKEAVRVLKEDGIIIISTPNVEMRKNINNPFHIKEYNIYELNDILKKYFKNINYYSVSDFQVELGFEENAVNIVAVCSNK